jgi:hypothetical protein
LELEREREREREFELKKVRSKDFQVNGVAKMSGGGGDPLL